MTILPIMTEVIQDFLSKGVPQKGRITTEICCFLLAKVNGAAQIIMKLSPWREYYSTLPMQLYLAVTMLKTLCFKTGW
jgi:hypothetical protein